MGTLTLHSIESSRNRIMGYKKTYSLDETLIILPPYFANWVKLGAKKHIQIQGTNLIL
jgi:hypothetical protein